MLENSFALFSWQLTKSPIPILIIIMCLNVLFIFYKWNVFWEMQYFAI